jgi:hypothetical protein
MKNWEKFTVNFKFSSKRTQEVILSKQGIYVMEMIQICFIGLMWIVRSDGMIFRGF